MQHKKLFCWDDELFAEDWGWEIRKSQPGNVLSSSESSSKTKLGRVIFYLYVFKYRIKHILIYIFSLLDFMRYLSFESEEIYKYMYIYIHAYIYIYVYIYILAHVYILCTIYWAFIVFHTYMHIHTYVYTMHMHQNFNKHGNQVCNFWTLILVKEQ